jgi:hypothetical protein
MLSSSNENAKLKATNDKIQFKAKGESHNIKDCEKNMTLVLHSKSKIKANLLTIESYPALGLRLKDHVLKREEMFSLLLENILVIISLNL